MLKKKKEKKEIKKEIIDYTFRDNEMMRPSYTTIDEDEEQENYIKKEKNKSV